MSISALMQLLTASWPRWVIAAAVLTIIVAWILRRWLRRLAATSLSWESYLRGQGAIIVGFLFLGVVFGWVSIYLAHPQEELTRDIRVTEFRQVSIGDRPEYEDLDIDGYRRVTVYAKALTPVGSSVGIRVLTDANQPAGLHAAAFTGNDAAWSRLETTVSGKRLTLMIGAGELGQI